MDVVVIGAGQAGLSSAYFLRRWGLDHVVLDANPGPGGAWRHRWPSLRLAGVHGIHDLPGLPLTDADPTRPASEVVAEYFGAYERHFALDVHRPVHVDKVTDEGDHLLVHTSTGVWPTRALINATGTWDKPFWPRYPGQHLFRGRQLHTADYHDPTEFDDQRVIVVGGGTSAVQLLTEIAPHARTTTWVTRRPPVFHETPWTDAHGRAVINHVTERVEAGKPPESVVKATGLTLTPEVAKARANGLLTRHPMFDHLTPEGAVWPDGTFRPADTILWATGFRAALDHLSPLRLRSPGGGIRVTGTQVATDPRIHLVGYGPSASTVGASRAGRSAANAIRAYLAQSPALATLP